MFLAIDIGNTNITLGLYNNVQSEIIKIWRIATSKKKTVDEYAITILDILHYSGIDEKKIEDIAIASVVPSIDSVFSELTESYFNKKAFFVTIKNASDFKIPYGNPDDVGADRIADAVAVYKLFGGPAIVIDFGTATTFDCIDSDGTYLGGAIAPGPEISAQSLAQRTAKLPQVNIALPKNVIGRSTVECIQSGLYYGYIGLVKEIISRLKENLKPNAHIIATGGLATLIVKEISEIKHIIPELTLEGIRIIYQNKK
ncbi:MAG: type III pantothenate kinase [Endomicrobiaceae bacterium]|nr:type III pantothenate kinase [Endomicrobiaceae bacterium]